MQAESFRKGRRALSERAQSTNFDTRLNTLRPVDLRVRSPINGVLVADHAERCTCLRAPFVEPVSILLHHSGRITFSDDALGNQIVRIKLAGRRILSNDAIHHGLRRSRLVSPSVAMTPLANVTNHHTLAQLN